MYAIMNALADWILVELGKREWSQADLARRAGVSRSAISDIITGKRNVGRDLAVSISEAFRVPLEEVFRAAGILPQTSNDPWVDKQAHKLSRISDPTLRETAERLINSLAEQEEAAAKSQLKHKRVPK